MFKKEKSAVLSLAAIMAFRMLGLFMILPVFSVYAQHLPHATPFLIGLALGIYGLTQAALQIPFGILSDKIGRKPVMAIGLGLFALGSIFAALSHSITGVIIGRALQGTGAIGSTVLATVADLTRDENRSKAMAVLGLTIGFAFTAALIIGPLVHAGFGLSGIFWFTALLAVVGLVLLTIAVPTPPKFAVHQNLSKRFSAVFKNTQLLRLNAGIFSLHAMLTALFISLPILFTHILQLTQTHQVLLYLVVLLVSFALMLPFIIIAEKQRKMKSIFLGAISVILFSQVGLFLSHHHVALIAVLLLFFFTAFTLLEASLPSLISKISPIRNKGAAMGVYSASQFLGIFVGGMVGGFLFGHFGVSSLFIFCAALAFVWLILASTMQQPPYLSTVILPAPDHGEHDELLQILHKMTGVVEVAIMAEEALIYVKADRKKIDKHELRNAIEAGSLR